MASYYSHCQTLGHNDQPGALVVSRSNDMHGNWPMADYYF